MRVLVVEDEEKLAAALKRGLEREGYAVDVIADGPAAERRILMSRHDHDLVVLDLMLPGKDGFEVCRAARDAGVVTPIIILTARDHVDDKIKALDAGADDYLVKPFSFEELLARMRALMRRPREALPTELVIGDLKLNPATREVNRGTRKIDLTLKEFELLHFLMRHPNQALSREDIFAHLWDFADSSLSNVIDVHVKNLRKKLDGKGEEKLVETVHGIGYSLKI
jgi:DNA-binding response OmpR family regulator